MNADIALRIRLQLQASGPERCFVEGSVVKQAEPFSCLKKQAEPA